MRRMFDDAVPLFGEHVVFRRKKKSNRAQTGHVLRNRVK
jgi:hypothetical protein